MLAVQSSSSGRGMVALKRWGREAMPVGPFKDDEDASIAIVGIGAAGGRRDGAIFFMFVHIFSKIHRRLFVGIVQCSCLILDAREETIGIIVAIRIMGASLNIIRSITIIEVIKKRG